MQVFFSEKRTIFAKKLSIFAFGLEKLSPDPFFRIAGEQIFVIFANFAHGGDLFVDQGAVKVFEPRNGKDTFVDIFRHRQSAGFIDRRGVCRTVGKVGGLAFVINIHSQESVAQMQRSSASGSKSLTAFGCDRFNKIFE